MAVKIEKLRDTKQESGKGSSKGNQNKWVAQDIWYKEDGLGYEALAEILVSRLLEKTNIDSFVSYAYESIEKGCTAFHGCRSKSFMGPKDDKVVSVERLFQTFYGESAAKAVLRWEDPAERISYVTECVEKATGLKDFGIYVRKALTVDALFLNEDRHFHNLAVIQRRDGTYRECPLFDNGAALFSDIRGDYPLDMPLDQCYEKIEAKPFSRDFDEQLDACEMLYGEFRFQARFTIQDVERILEKFSEAYDNTVRNRIIEVMRRQIRKYAYFFS